MTRTRRRSEAVPTSGQRFGRYHRSLRTRFTQRRDVHKVAQRSEIHSLAGDPRSARSSLVQVALAWLLHRATNVLPIPGTSSTTHLEQNLGAADIRLTAEQYDLIAASQDSDEDRGPQS